MRKICQGTVSVLAPGCETPLSLVHLVFCSWDAPTTFCLEVETSHQWRTAGKLHKQWTKFSSVYSASLTPSWYSVPYIWHAWIAFFTNFLNVNKGVICSAAHAPMGSDPNCNAWCCFLCGYTLLFLMHIPDTHNAQCVWLRVARARRVTRPVWTEGYQQQADLLELSAERYLPTFLWKTSNKTLVGTCPDKTTMPQLGLDGCFFVLVCFA